MPNCAKIQCLLVRLVADPSLDEPMRNAIVAEVRERITVGTGQSKTSDISRAFDSYFLGRTYISEGRNEEANREWRIAAFLAPNVAAMHLTQAHLLSGSDPAGAEKCIKEAHKHIPLGCPYVRLIEIFVQLAKGRPEAATSYYWKTKRCCQDKVSEAFTKLLEREEKRVTNKGKVSIPTTTDYRLRVIQDSVDLGITDEAERCKRVFEESLLQPNKTKKHNGNPELVVAQRWNSFSPILGHSGSRGGGYLLMVDSDGLVIDPGRDCIRNIFECGFCFTDITAVFISHAHFDHVADCESILTLLHEYNAYIQRGFDDPYTRENHPDKSGYKHLDFFVSAGVFQKFSGFLRLHPEKVHYSVHVIKPGEIFVVGKTQFTALPCIHNDAVSDNTGIGFSAGLSDGRYFVYTADTSWGEAVKEAYLPYSGKCALLLAHLGGLENIEYDLLKYDISDSAVAISKEILKFRHKKHLGLLGIAEALALLRPDFTAIGEFGEECRGLRKELVEIIVKHTKFHLSLNGNILLRIKTHPYGTLL